MFLANILDHSIRESRRREPPDYASYIFTPILMQHQLEEAIEKEEAEKKKDDLASKTR